AGNRRETLSLASRMRGRRELSSQNAKAPRPSTLNASLNLSQRLLCRELRIVHGGQLTNQPRRLTVRPLTCFRQINETEVFGRRTLVVPFDSTKPLNPRYLRAFTSR